MSLFKRKKIARSMTGICLDAGGIAAASIIRRPGGKPLVSWCDFRSFNESANATMANLARERQLKRAHCTTVLATTDYKLVMTEAPEVPDGELTSALRWKIKDMIDIPVADVTIDVFDAPATNASGRARPLYVVAARNAALKDRVDMLNSAAINLQIIDIPELAQRNIAMLLDQDKSGVALLALSAQSGLLTLTRQGVLYLARNLGVGLEGLLNHEIRAPVQEQIVLEIQRSLDFFESNFRQAPIRHVVLGPLPESIAGLTEYLQTNLGVTVTQLDFSQLLEWRVETNRALQARCFNALGAALRYEGASA